MDKIKSLGKTTHRAFYLLLIVLAFTVFQVQAAVVFETSRSIGDFATGGARPTAISIPSHLIGNGTNRAIFVGISTQTIIPVIANRVVRVTFGPQSGCPTPIPPAVSDCEFRRVNTLATFSPDNQNAVEIFVLVNPPTDTRSIEISLLPAGVDYVVAGSASFTGVSQTTPHGNYNSSSGTFNQSNGLVQPSVNVADGITGEIIFDTLSFSFSGGTSLPGTGQELLFQGRSFFNNTSDVGAGSMKPDTTISSTDNVLMSWQLNLTSNWALGAIAIKQAVFSASPASITGQIKTKDEEPLGNVSVTIQNLQTGEVFQTTTNEKGVYFIEGLGVTNLYQITAYSNFYTFSLNERVVNLTESLEEIDFYGFRRKRKETFFK